MARILLAVDLSYQTYRAAASHAGLTCGQVFTGGLYGFLMTLAKQIRVVGATHVVICRDMKPYKRSEVYPNYKQLRKKNADEDLLRAFNQSLPMVTEAMSVVGIEQLGHPGYESDDCIGAIARTHRHRFDLIYAASNDSDLFQLLCFDSFRLFRGSEPADIFDRKRIESGPMGMTPAEFMLAQALQGTHNDVEGIPGVGAITAYKAVKDAASMRKLRERWAAVIDRNVMLSQLPYPGMPRLDVPRQGDFNARALYRFCSRYDIDVTKSMVDSFEQVSR